MPKRKRGSKLTKGVKKKSNPRPWPSVGRIMEEISVAVSNPTEEEKDEPCFNQDSSLLEFVRSEEISNASGEDKAEHLLDEHSDYTYAAKEQPFENKKNMYTSI